MIVVRTVEGNHMRQHREGGRSNQREIDVIVEEVIREHCQGFADDRYRRHHGVPSTRPIRAADVLDEIEVDTDPQIPGTAKAGDHPDARSWTRPGRGRTGLPFVDDPQKINVAVSRAIQRFIVVTNHDMLPTSRHIRDLVGYIRYHNPGEDVVDSAVSLRVRPAL